jgi:hypothetical protein
MIILVSRLSSLVSRLSSHNESLTNYAKSSNTKTPAFLSEDGTGAFLIQSQTKISKEKTYYV